MKRIISILLICIFIIQITACRNDNDGNIDDSGNSAVKDSNKSGNFGDFDIDNYIYLPYEVEISDLEEVVNTINGAMAHGENITFWYNGYYDIFVYTLTADGNTREETRLPGPDRLYQVNGLSITDDHYAVVATASGANDEVVVKYLVYDKTGNKIKEQELFSIPQYFNTFTQVEYVVITDNYIAVVTGTDNQQLLYLMTIDGEKLGELTETRIGGMARLKDDRVVALFNERSSSSLREIDFATGSWGDTHHLAINDVGQLIQANTALSYDFFIDAGGYLIGYVLETDTQTPLINWLESGIAVTPQYHIGMLTNNDIYTLYSEHVRVGGNFRVISNLTVFNRSQREENIQQRTVITIGGMYIDQNLRKEIASFNKESEDYQIEIREYHSEELGYEGSRLRMLVELIAGRGPDIILESNSGETTDFLVDLYTFIDADPELDRSDFFPNVLHALERPAGKLPFIANNFMIMTMVAKRETAERLYPLTFDSILQNLDLSDPYSYAGRLITGGFFISRAVFNSGSFIGWDNRKVDFDNDEFISLLEIAAKLPVDFGSGQIDMQDEVKRLAIGEQLLMSVYISRPDSFQRIKVQTGDIVPVGVPTLSGGQNMIHIMGDIGIYAMSPNQDAAWSFIRRLFLPEANVDTTTSALPLRIDKFEEQLAELMVQEFWDEDIPMFGAVKGEEKPKYHIGSGGLLGIPIYAMTEEEAMEIRLIIESATTGTRSDLTIWDIIDEEYESFVNGIRSASDAARIIQNRVQTYFDEQG